MSLLNTKIRSVKATNWIIAAVLILAFSTIALTRFSEYDERNESSASEATLPEAELLLTPVSLPAKAGDEFSVELQVKRNGNIPVSVVAALGFDPDVLEFSSMSTPKGAFPLDFGSRAGNSRVVIQRFVSPEYVFTPEEDIVKVARVRFVLKTDSVETAIQTLSANLLVEQTASNQYQDSEAQSVVIALNAPTEIPTPTMTAAPTAVPTATPATVATVAPTKTTLKSVVLEESFNTDTGDWRVNSNGGDISLSLANSFGSSVSKISLSGNAKASQFYRPRISLEKGKRYVVEMRAYASKNTTVDLKMIDHREYNSVAQFDGANSRELKLTKTFQTILSGFEVTENSNNIRMQLMLNDSNTDIFIDYIVIREL